MNKNRYLLLFLGTLAIGLYFGLGLNESLTLHALKAHHDELVTRVDAAPVESAALFAALYVLVTGLSLPGAALLTLAGGAVFGFWRGLVLVSFASTIGATVAFLASRFLFRKAVEARFGERLRSFDDGVARDGPFYLLTLRLVPLFPFFLVNIGMGLTSMRTWTYFWVSQLGMLPGTAVFVYAGTEIARIDSIAAVASPGLIAALTLLGVFPLLARAVIGALARRRVYRGWEKPASFDRNLVVIGGGAAGLVSAYIGATVRAKVTLVERQRMGGDSLNTGCVPSKALIEAARVANNIRHAGDYGIRVPLPEVDFNAVMARVKRAVEEVAPHDSVERYTSLGVECLQGHAKITSPWTVEITAGGQTRTLSTRAIVIATGARPHVPPIPGIETTGYLTSETLWELDCLPRRVLVLGGGPIGCEIAQALRHLGSEVAIVDAAAHLLPREDVDVAQLVERRFRADGIVVHTGHRAMRFTAEGDTRTLHAAQGVHETAIVFDTLICAMGRAPDTAALGLEALEIPLTPSNTVEVNEYMQTRYPNIYACGDVAGPYQFTHTAAHTAWYATVNALFSPLRRLRADFTVIPWATFTDPEVARVGLSEREARERGIPHEVTKYDTAELDRAIAEGRREGLVKVLTIPGQDRILGAAIAGPHAGERIVEFVNAMREGKGLNRILGAIHIYPTWSEGNKYAAGEWKRAHAPRWALDMAARFHDWRRT